MTSASHPRDRFATTRWSTVMHPASTLSGDASTALTELAQRYGYPVYAYVRRCGHAPTVAHDIMRTFLGCLMGQFREGLAHPPQGHFRIFLLDQLNAFLGGDWREVVDSGPSIGTPAPGDMEARNLHDNANAGSPEQAYHSSFALEVMSRALGRLRSEAHQTGHLDMFEALQQFLAQDPLAGELQVIAQRLKCQPLTLAVALRRLRQRFRELAGTELADTVTSASDLATEQVALHAALKSIQMQ